LRSELGVFEVAGVVARARGARASGRATTTLATSETRATRVVLHTHGRARERFVSVRRGVEGRAPRSSRKGHHLWGGLPPDRSAAHAGGHWLGDPGRAGRA